ncbi:hypothetical protein Ndes2526A_g01258 [Nannochloris sp. 'desiccata']
MAATATADAVITVKQHGFVVKEGPPSFSTRRSTDYASTREDAGGSGLNRSILGLLNSRTATPPPPTAATLETTYGVSPGLPRAGDVRPAEYTHLTPGVKKIMRGVMRGLKAHQDPEAATEGLGGTYFFRNEAGVKIAIMKPCDEEPMAPNNPKGFVGRQLGEPGLKPTVRVGEAASREVAAYLLDHDHFASVPHTVMVRMSHPVFHIASTENNTDIDTTNSNGLSQQQQQQQSGESTERCESSDPASYIDEENELPLKLGSLQEYAPHECDTSELGASRFNKRDVQRIGILDIRLFNTDRHAGNILVRRVRPHSSLARMDTAALADLHLKEPYELIPIDHGFALPEALEPPYFEWQHWPQALMPFGQEELEYISKLDPRADSDMLRRELPGLREESLRLLEVSTTLLKRCAAAGLSLSDIAGVVTRPLIGLDDDPSELEKLCASVRDEIDAEAAAALVSDYGEEEEGEEEEEVSDTESEDEDVGVGVGGTVGVGQFGGLGGGVLSPLKEGDDEAEAMLSVEGGSIVLEDGDTSPGGESATTHFQFDREDGDASVSVRTPAAIATVGTTGGKIKIVGAVTMGSNNVDDALFSMDEDGNGHRTPLPASPDAFVLLRRLTNAPSLVVRRTGELATPGAVVGVSFGSALASSDSLPTSYDSDSPTAAEQKMHALRMHSVDSSSGDMGSSLGLLAGRSKSSAFPMATSLLPNGFATAGKPAARRAAAANNNKTHHRRQRGGGGRRGKAARAQAYPPLVQQHSANASSASQGVFSGLTAQEWDEFMRLFELKVKDALLNGEWVQNTLGGLNGPAPLMSCPKF